MKSLPLKIIVALVVLVVGFTAATYVPIWFNIDISKPGIGCAQVIVTAKNIVTQEVRTFSDPCHVPFGWKQVQSGVIMETIP